MNRLCILIVFLLGILAGNAKAALIEYEITDLGGDRHEYQYTVMNNSLSVAIEEFTIWFDVDLYDNLTITTPEPLANTWDEIILQETGFGLPLGYDALSLDTGIQIDEAIGGFSVSFDWIGTGEPDSQFFEIIDPVTFETIDSGYTVPEPLTLWFLVCGSIILRRYNGY